MRVITPCRLRVVGIMCAVIALVSSTSAFAQITVEDTVPAFEQALSSMAGGEIPFAGISLGSQSAAGEDPGTELINGTIVDATFFPAVLRAVSGGACTASLIGPSAAMLAAHCFSSDIAMFNFTVAGQTFRGICEAAPGFSERRSEDWALCLLERRVGGIAYETVNLTALPAVGSRIVLVGFGCTFEGEAPAIRPLKAGVSRLVNRSGGAGERSYIATKSDPDAGEAILCKGDSGGPAFVFLGSTVSDSRKIVGVNSRTLISEGLGLISATASAAGAAFIKDWAQRNDQAICGHNPSGDMRCM